MALIIINATNHITTFPDIRKTNKPNWRKSLVILPSYNFTFIDKEIFFTINGTITDSDNNPVKRLVYAVRGDMIITSTMDQNVSVYETESSYIDGSYSFNVPGNKNDTYSIISIGHSDKNEDTVLISKIKGPV